MSTTAASKLLADSVLKAFTSRSRPLIVACRRDRRWLFTSGSNQCKPFGSSGDFFQLFSLNKKFEMNPAELTKQFRLLQNQWHPDKFVGKTKVCAYFNFVFKSFIFIIIGCVVH